MEEKQLEYKDVLGNELYVGALIVYYTRQSSSMYAHAGRVVAQDFRPHFRGTSPTLKVRAASEGYSRGWVSNSREVTLTSFDTIVRVDRLPIEALQAIDKVPR